MNWKRKPILRWPLAARTPPQAMQWGAYKGMTYLVMSIAIKQVS